MEIDILEIIVNDRHRKELGDVDALAESIRTVGLLQPVVVTPENHLIAGRRRMEALKRLGYRHVPVHIVGGLNDALSALLAERDENTCRKPFTLSESVSVGETLAALEKPKAKKRMATSTGGSQPSPASEKFSEAEKGRTLDKVGLAVGLSRITYRRAAAIVEAAEADPVRFVPLVQEMDKKGKVNGTYEKMKRLQAETHRAKLTSAIHGEHTGVKVGDFRETLATLSDESVDLIFTDPPYDKESIALYGDLAQHASRLLKDGGSLVCYAGQYAMPFIFPLVTPHLKHQWTLAVRHSGGKRNMHGWRVRVGWKPLLWFVKGRYLGEYILDLLDSKPGDKLAHEWAQGHAEAAYLIENLSPKGGMVLDPMCGSGTTLLAARHLERKFLGIEIDPQRARVAIARLAS